MDVGISMSSTKCDRKSKIRTSLRPYEREDSRRVVHAIVARAITELLPHGIACSSVMQVRVVGLGETLEEDRIRRVACVEGFQDRNRLVGTVFVPDVNQVTLKVGLAAQEAAA